MQTTNNSNLSLTKSMALQAANTSYSCLLKKIVSNLIVRSLLIFLLTIVTCYALFQDNFEQLKSESPAVYSYLVLFGVIYLAIQLFLTAYILRKHVILPLQDFIEAAQQLASGSKDVQLDLVRSNEFLNLNDAFKFIKLELNEKDKRIESYQKSLEQLIDERTSDLKQALKLSESTTQAKSEFFANITHELRTPLNGILGMTDLILDSNLTQDQRSSLEHVRDSGNNLLSLVNDFLEYSKVETGKISLFNENIDLTKLISRCLLVLNIKADQKGITIVDKIEKNVPRFIVSDHLRIKQILQNLITNSLKFSNNCGAIVVWVGIESIKDDGLELHIGVSDTGIGIPKDKVEHIFENLKKEAPGLAINTQGNGLGLNLCKEIVNLMGGKIWVKSKEGIGTAIHFTIKCKVSHTERDLSSDNLDLHNSSEAETVNAAVKTKHILVCEDNPVNSKLVVTLLERSGYRVTTVENGEKAIEKLQAEMFDMILMDCQMPVMNGFETTEFIRKKRRVLNPDVPIIALTANASKEDRQKCLNCGMNAFITKPIQKEKFYEILNNFLPKQL